jgi:hypothetical protein
VVNPGYEFTAEQNVTLSGLAARMRFVGAALIVVALLAVAESLTLSWRGSGGFVGVAIGAILLLIGAWSVRASGQFRAVAASQGADISHLMNAITAIRRLYDVQFWALLVVAVLLSLSLISVMAGPARVPAVLP